MPIMTSKLVRPTKADLIAARNGTLPDVIAEDLAVLFCGINPGLYTAATGWHFGRPGNRFWRAIFDAGFTPRLLSPSQQSELLKFGLGITNLVARATSAASELSAEEIKSGGELLLKKTQSYRPKWVAFVGIGAYRIAFGRPTAILGQQPEHLADSGIWVLPNTSGLNANHRPEDFARLFGALRDEIKLRES